MPLLTLLNNFKIPKEIQEAIFNKLKKNPFMYALIIIQIQKFFIENRLLFFKDTYVFLEKILPSEAALIRYNMYFHSLKYVRLNYNLDFKQGKIERFITKLQARDEKLIMSLGKAERYKTDHNSEQYDIATSLLQYYINLEYINYYLSILRFILQLCFWSSIFL